MKEHPILFNGAMVRAILAGSKTQTRRPIKGVPPSVVRFEVASLSKTEFGKKAPIWLGWTADDKDIAFHAPCPFGVVGDRLWVRETFACPETVRYYRAADEGILPPGTKWTPSIHMPRWASRINLEVTEVRVQRVQDISEEDAKAEGMSPCIELSSTEEHSSTYRCAFADLWGDVYGTWDRNDWVWATTFKRVLP